MKKLFKDRRFSKKQMEKLSKTLDPYLERKKLESMHKRDKMGSKKAAIPVTFLSYFIQSKKHQGLYNIISIVGERFYILNDLDNWKEPIYIELRNDDSTKNRWIIYLLKKTPGPVRPKKKKKKS